MLDVTRGNVAEVKIVLASIVAALAIYQLVLIAVAYGKVRPPFLAGPAASRVHRGVGDAILLITLVVAFACLAVYGIDDEGGVHAIAGVALIGVFTGKVGVVRFGGERLGRFLPILGLTLFALFALTWATSAGDALGELP